MAQAIVEVVSGPDGHPAAAKRSADPALVARLRREAEVLAEAARPAVVALIALEEDGTTLTLLTAWVPGGTLADARPIPRGRALRILAAVATTVADLHARALAHGRLTADHVLLDASDQPVLCGFAEAGPASPVACGADVAALGALVELVLERPTLDGLRGGAHRPLDWDVVALAARTHDADPAARPTAATLAAVLTGALDREAGPPTASQPGTAATRPRRWPGSPRLPAWSRTPVGVAAGVACVVLLAMVALTAVLGGGAARAGGDTAASDATPAPAPTSPPAAPRAPATTLDEPPATLATTTSTSTTAVSAPVVEGAQVTLADGRRFAVGDPGDVVVVGDWNCDGEATAAVLRPTTGEVFVFDTWPDGEAAAARPVAVVPGATVLQPRPGDGPHCLHLAVRDVGSGHTQDVV